MTLAYSIGNGPRNDTSINRTAQIVPGAGAYDQNTNYKRAAPKWGFGTGKRPKLNKDTASM